VCVASAPPSPRPDRRSRAPRPAIRPPRRGTSAQLPRPRRDRA
jgi:hypothetical protein